MPSSPRLVAAKVIRFIVVSTCAAAALWILAWLVRPDLSTPRTIDPQVVVEAEEARQALVGFEADPNQQPTMHRDIHVDPRGQSPILTEMVEAGELPPLDERLPNEPIVMEGPDGIGSYGGTWLRAANGPTDVSVIDYRMSGPFLVRWSPLGYPLKNHIAKSVEPSEDFRAWTVHLRPGMRWSDGDPFDADDIMYYWECEATHPMVAGSPPFWMYSGGKPGRIEKIDRYTLKFIFEVPFPLFRETLASSSAKVLCDRPAHYLRQYHPDPEIGDEQVIQRDMAAYHMPSPLALYTYMKDFRNPESPRMWPWVYRTFKSSPPQVFVRNPYYYVVDPEGNQLPYIDRVQFDILDSKMFNVTVANGGVTMQARHVRFQDYTELMSRRDTNGTEVYHWYPATRGIYVINPNLNRHVDPDDPASAWKAKLLADKRFRQALSLALDRHRIIRGEYSGVGEPSQINPGPQSPLYNEKAAKAYTEHDPERANALLDELDLTQRDYEGYRTFPDGTRMTFFFDTTEYTGPGPVPFIIDDWRGVGLRVVARQRSRPLFYIEKDGRLFDFNVWSSESDYTPLIYARHFIPNNTESFYAVGWGRWYERGGFHGTRDASEINGAVAVPRDSPMYEAISLFEQARTSNDPAEQKRLMDGVLEIAGENLWSIGLATAPPQPVVVQKDLRNVPRNALCGVIYSTPANAGVETYYFEHPPAAPAADREVRQSITQPTLRPGGAVEQSRTVSHLLKWLFIIAGLLVVAMFAVRHPFVRKRLLIMVPTLAIISVIVFTIIQLPPGDFLATRIIQLQESGDPSDLRTVEDLQKLFHTEESATSRYLRWMGLRWFVTFDAADTGLLQGDLGRSMETTLPVNSMVGDRLLLTFLISLGTIALTWAIAIPIGIYSAVRQYTISDYVLTLLGFVGMCVPAFLLALVLMAISDVQGLFSPEFAAQPGWSWAKFVDLLRHIWIPIVVLGVGGTAAMIRIMRANLLDELRKPYVVTARAKGVRPMKLLFKYPVRIAINPFVSGIGALFPQLVSGGAIVAMVLALPTIGPLLLAALFTEDMYLAGSMLVLLSMLGVVGTLVSDLLLLWLDPRIRFEGGGR